MLNIMRNKTLVRALMLSVSLSALNSGEVGAATGSLTGLGSFGGSLGGFGSETNLNGVSNNGGVVVGDATLADNVTIHAFRWTASGLVDLGTLGGANSFGSGVSADGSVVVGGSNPAGLATTHAFRWTQATGMIDLGTLGGSNSIANAVSADGNVVVGGARDLTDTDRAFRWTQAGGMVDLGTLGGTFSFGNGVSADGNVAVGLAALTGDTAQHAFLWTQSGGMTDLGTFGGTNSSALGISADGLVAVGAANLAGDVDEHAFRWTASSGLVDLGVLPGSTSSVANAVSATGKVVVGGTNGGAAFRWTQPTGIQDLNSLLSAAGVNMTGITLQAATGLSADGRFIVGNGSSPSFPGGEAFLVLYDDGNGEAPSIYTIAGITTVGALQSSVQTLSDSQRASLIQNRVTAYQLLGFTRPISSETYAFAGGMFGSAIGYAGAQYAKRDFTLLGGIAYGTQDYPNIKQDGAVTLALAGRYTFADPFHDKARALRPFVELGAWVQPRATLTLSRDYANGAGLSTGVGKTDATTWAEYGRGGVIWDFNARNQFTAYGELGQHYLSFASYAENSALNPFAASIEGGELRMDIARLGGSWTHRITGLHDHGRPMPVAITLAGAAAHAFDVEGGVKAHVGSIGLQAVNKTEVWGEFGARLEAQLTDHLSLNMDISGTTGGGLIDTAVHGGLGLTYRF